MKKIIIFLIFIFFNNISFAEDKITLGKKIFNEKAQCGVCHTLQKAGSEGEIGPNLDLLKPQMEQIILAVTNGIGVMQPWKDILTEEEIEAVAYYVFQSTNN